jgi:hypothetical protein
MNYKQKCWYTKKSATNDNKIYYVNKESGISQWGKLPDEESEILPAGWQHHISKSGNSFYYNVHDNFAQWTKPIEKDKSPVPKGWEEMRSTNCKNVYYKNSKTGKTQWEYPEIPSRGSVGNYEEITPDINSKLTSRRDNRTRDNRRRSRTRSRNRDNRSRMNLKKKIEMLKVLNDDLSENIIETREAMKEIHDQQDRNDKLQLALDQKQDNIEMDEWDNEQSNIEMDEWDKDFDEDFEKYYNSLKAIEIINDNDRKFSEHHTKDTKGIGLPFPEQTPRNLAKKSLEKMRNEKSRIDIPEKYNGYWIDKVSIPFTSEDDIEQDY